MRAGSIARRRCRRHARESAVAADASWVVVTWADGGLVEVKMKSERMSRTCWEADGDRGSLSDLSDSLGSLGSLSSLSGSPAVSASLEKVEPIDSRIQQALDLVKSHLLLAVREEVDLLKANINKLADRIGVLERENRMLKKGVSPEVLAKLRKTPALAGHARQQTPEAPTAAH